MNVVHSTGANVNLTNDEDTSLPVCSICLDTCDPHDSSSSTYRLLCSHVYHHDCLLGQIRNFPDVKGKLTFNSLRCGTCRIPFDLQNFPSASTDPSLLSVVRPMLTMREQVDDMIVTKLRELHLNPDSEKKKEDEKTNDKPNNTSSSSSSQPSREYTKDELLTYGKQKLSFYLCGECRQPFFGGLAECEAVEINPSSSYSSSSSSVPNPPCMNSTTGSTNPSLGDMVFSSLLGTAGSLFMNSLPVAVPLFPSSSSSSSTTTANDDDDPADDNDDNDDDNKLPTCPGCTKLPPGYEMCKVHGKESILWKCLWCCSIATHSCRAGYKFYCDPCHDRAVDNAKRTGTELDWGPIVKAESHRHCDGTGKCKLGIPHPKHGTRFPVGCSICAVQAQEAMRPMGINKDAMKENTDSTSSSSSISVAPVAPTSRFRKVQNSSSPSTLVPVAIPVHPLSSAFGAQNGNVRRKLTSSTSTMNTVAPPPLPLHPLPGFSSSTIASSSSSSTTLPARNAPPTRLTDSFRTSTMTPNRARTDAMTDIDDDQDDLQKAIAASLLSGPQQANPNNSNKKKKEEDTDNEEEDYSNDPEMQKIIEESKRTHQLHQQRILSSIVPSLPNNSSSSSSSSLLSYGTAPSTAAPFRDHASSTIAIPNDEDEQIQLAMRLSMENDSISISSSSSSSGNHNSDAEKVLSTTTIVIDDDNDNKDNNDNDGSSPTSVVHPTAPPLLHHTMVSKDNTIHQENNDEIDLTIVPPVTATTGLVPSNIIDLTHTDMNPNTDKSSVPLPTTTTLPGNVMPSSSTRSSLPSSTPPPPLPYKYKSDQEIRTEEEQQLWDTAMVQISLYHENITAEIIELSPTSKPSSSSASFNSSSARSATDDRDTVNTIIRITTAGFQADIHLRIRIPLLPFSLATSSTVLHPSPSSEILEIVDILPSSAAFTVHDTTYESPPHEIAIARFASIVIRLGLETNDLRRFQWLAHRIDQSSVRTTDISVLSLKTVFNGNEIESQEAATQALQCMEKFGVFGAYRRDENDQRTHPSITNPAVQQRETLLRSVLYACTYVNAHCFVCGRVLVDGIGLAPRTCGHDACLRAELNALPYMDLYSELKSKGPDILSVMIDSVLAASQEGIDKLDKLLVLPPNPWLVVTGNQGNGCTVKKENNSSSSSSSNTGSSPPVRNIYSQMVHGNGIVSSTTHPSASAVTTTAATTTTTTSTVTVDWVTLIQDLRCIQNLVSFHDLFHLPNIRSVRLSLANTVATLALTKAGTQVGTTTKTDNNNVLHNPTTGMNHGRPGNNNQPLHNGRPPVAPLNTSVPSYGTGLNLFPLSSTSVTNNYEAPEGNPIVRMATGIPFDTVQEFCDLSLQNISTVTDPLAEPTDLLRNFMTTLKKRKDNEKESTATEDDTDETNGSAFVLSSSSSSSSSTIDLTIAKPSTIPTDEDEQYDAILQYVEDKLQSLGETDSDDLRTILLQSAFENKLQVLGEIYGVPVSNNGTTNDKTMVDDSILSRTLTGPQPDISSSTLTLHEPLTNMTFATLRELTVQLDLDRYYRLLWWLLKSVRCDFFPIPQTQLPLSVQYDSTFGSSIQRKQALFFAVRAHQPQDNRFGNSSTDHLTDNSLLSLIMDRSGENSSRSKGSTGTNIYEAVTIPGYTNTFGKATTTTTVGKQTRTTKSTKLGSGTTTSTDTNDNNQSNNGGVGKQIVSTIISPLLTTVFGSVNTSTGSNATDSSAKGTSSSTGITTASPANNAERLYLYHGTRNGRIISILRTGLRTLSGTSLQQHGAAYGKGIYLGGHFSLSLQYSNQGAIAVPMFALNSSSTKARNPQYYCVFIVSVTQGPHLTANGGLAPPPLTTLPNNGGTSTTGRLGSTSSIVGPPGAIPKLPTHSSIYVCTSSEAMKLEYIVLIPR